MRFIIGILSIIICIGLAIIGIASQVHGAEPLGFGVLVCIVAGGFGGLGLGLIFD